ncbi:HIT domain-containing protein [Maritimibacter dapengensis]|uniref:HIT domain-containing protein n=1 Tax=Maritimibacter dapengensis TaxID=2836868 RepID=A0ABS6SX42_9RHOB|nr:HIT domain-containing protein [Maritimibacter dapengensis]MBV7377295.1 HIT domain-containing protein [Maritimibacter dapengensis]
MTERLSASQLEDFVRNRMKMSHIYQPVMLKVLLDAGGEVSVEDVSRALLVHDLSQVEYYAIRTKNMVGKVLHQNGIVEPMKRGNRIIGYRLNSEGLSELQRKALSALCDQKVAQFLKQRGAVLYDHRRPSDGYVPGSIRYTVLKRAKYRCELCGAHEDQAALHIDHIIPRAKGGPDDLSNFQALCITCNTNKRDNDDTDFRDVLNSYEERDESCLFCKIEADRIVGQNQLAYAIRDAYPVTELHTLVLPKRHVANYFDLYQPERNAIEDLLQRQRKEICTLDRSVSGFNIGANAGASAGQTVFHVHLHLIPRRGGDVQNPRGGVRGVITDKQSY